MIAAAPRKNVNGETCMRPWRIGTSSGTRVCGLLREHGDRVGRRADGSHSAWEERGTSARAAFPRAARSRGRRMLDALGLRPYARAAHTDAFVHGTVVSGGGCRHHAPVGRTRPHHGPSIGVHHLVRMMRDSAVPARVAPDD